MKKLLALLLLLLPLSAHAGIGQWSSTDTSNNGAAPTGWTTGMSPADVKLTGRRMMSFVHDAYLDSQWISEEVSPTWINTTTLTISTSDPTFYHVNRRIKTQSAAGLVFSTISASTAIGATGVSLTVVNDTGTISNTLFKVWFGAISAVSPSITSQTLGLGTLDTLVSNTTKVNVNSTSQVVSLTAGGFNSVWATTNTLVVSSTISTTTGGLIKTDRVSATSISATNVSASALSINNAVFNTGFNHMRAFTSTGTFTPSSTGVVFVRVWGGGGGGGNAITNNNIHGGGGGGGGYSEGFVTVSALASSSVTIGSGGSSATGGGTSSFVGAAVTVSATGGGAGTTGTVSNVVNAGAAGGTGSGGSLNLTGGTGDMGVANSATGTYRGGWGGCAAGGGGCGGNDAAGGFSTNYAGGTGVVPGGGGGGGYRTNGDASGGAGADGMVVIYYP